VAHVDLPTSGPPTHKLLRSLNALTPDELLITHIEEVPMDFHARFSPHIKTYVYQFDFHDRPHPMLKDRAAHMRLPIVKWEEISLTAKNFVGTHDFGSFCSIQNTSESTVRSVLDSHLDQITEHQLQFVIKGKGFLQHMVRILAGTLIAVGQGTLQREIVLEALKTGEGLREQLGLTLPAHGLHLKSTEYLHRNYWDSAEISPNIKASDKTP
jgi:tRNA pseudouridine38-40 synthase